MASLNTLQDQMKANGIVGKANGGTQVHPQASVDPVAEVERLAMQKRIAELEAENAKLRQQSQGKLTIKVSAKGAVSVYGLSKYPVTLYREQMTRLLDAKEQIEDFIKLNLGKLSSKGDEKPRDREAQGSVPPEEQVQ